MLHDYNKYQLIRGLLSLAKELLRTQEEVRIGSDAWNLTIDIRRQLWYINDIIANHPKAMKAEKG